MKKKLIAVAVAGALAAPVVALAQSSVSISGLFDIGARTTNAPANANSIQQGDARSIVTNGSSTTAIIISGTEDISKGLKGIFRFEMNPDFTNGTALNGGVGATNGAGVVALGNGATGYSFLGLESAQMGKLLLGRLNSPSLGVWGIASTFGTALGSGYGSNGNIYTRYSASTFNSNNTAPTRFNNAIEWTSASYSGVQARFLVVPKVDKTGLGSSLACTATTCAADGAAGSIGVNRAGVNDMSLAYSQGPMNVAISQQTIRTGSNGMSTLVTPNAQANGRNKLTTLAGSYEVGAFTGRLGFWQEDQQAADGTVAANTKAYSLGLTHVAGPFTTRVGFAKNDSTMGTNVDKTIMGLGLDYALSKRTSVYGRYENRDSDSNSSVDAAATGTTKVWHAGVRHSF